MDELIIADLIHEMQLLCKNDQEIPDHVLFDWQREEGCELMWADYDQFKQILFNLLRNAVEAVSARRKPRIRISVYHDDHDDEDMVHIAVVDNGFGIPEAERSRVMQPFYSTKSQGTGLGLALVQRMVYAHGGRLKMAGEDGVGCEVHLTLPAVEPVITQFHS